MTEVAGGEAADLDASVEAATKAVLSSQEPEEQATEPTNDIEAEARKMGWVPESEWKDGAKKPARFLSAETFVARGELLEQMKKEKAETAERLARIERTTNVAIENLKAQHAKELSDLRAKKREAVQAGDADEVDRLDQAIDTLKDNPPDAEPKKLAGAALEAHNQKVQNDWIASQSWWGVDEDMTAVAIGISQRLQAKKPDLSVEDNLAQTEEQLKTKFPEKFGGKKPAAAANGHAAVDGGSAFPASGGKKGKTAADLPADVRVIGEQMVKAKAYDTLDAYAKEYFRNA